MFLLFFVSGYWWNWDSMRMSHHKRELPSQNELGRSIRHSLGAEWKKAQTLFRVCSTDRGIAFYTLPSCLLRGLRTAFDQRTLLFPLILVFEIVSLIAEEGQTCPLLSLERAILSYWVLILIMIDKIPTDHTYSSILNPYLLWVVLRE